MRKFWTEAENELIRLHYPDNDSKSIVHLFENRKVGNIQQHAAKIGVKKSESFFKSPASGRISKDNDIGISTRFNKQWPGWNKGKKQVDYMSAENIEKIKVTQFKKGRDPHNTVAVGHERVTVDGYVEVKVRHAKDGTGKNKNFELKHRLIYIEYHGEIPENAKVYFIDGDKRNFEPENLGIETHAENLLKNTMCDTSIVKRFLGIKEPQLVDKIIKENPELIDLKRNVIKLNQKIKKKDVRKIK